MVCDILVSVLSKFHPNSPKTFKVILNTSKQTNTSKTITSLVEVIHSKIAGHTHVHKSSTTTPFLPFSRFVSQRSWTPNSFLALIIVNSFQVHVQLHKIVKWRKADHWAQLHHPFLLGRECILQHESKLSIPALRKHLTFTQGHPGAALPTSLSLNRQSSLTKPGNHQI